MKRKVSIAIFGLLSFVASNVTAATIVQYLFDDGVYNIDPAVDKPFLNPGVSVSDPNIGAISAWTDTDGTLTSLAGFSLDNRGKAVAARDWHDGNSFSFSFTVAGGYALNLDGFSFNEQASNGGQGLGPTAWSMFINGAEVANGAGFRGNPGALRSGPLSLTGLTGTVSLRIFATGSEDNNPNDAVDTAPNATWRIDNFTLTGATTAVPLPASLPLLLAAIGGIGAVARRRREK